MLSIAGSSPAGGSPAVAPWRVEVPEVVLTGVPFVVTLEDTLGLGDGPVRLTFAGGDDRAGYSQPVRAGAARIDSVRVGTGTKALVLQAAGTRQEVPLRVLPGWISLLPPLLAITLALVTRQVVVALLLGIWVGALIVFDLNPLVAFLRLGDRFLVTALADRSHATILLFSTILGGMVGILSRSGATEGVVGYLAGKVRGRRGGQTSTAVMGTAIFFDDYANTLLVGNTMRPLTDRLRISREKLSYLVDSTAAPVATIAVISTWVGFEVGLIQDAMAKHGAEGSAYTFFLRSIPYGYYPLLTLLFVYMIAGLGRDYGPMLTAERRVVHSGEVLRPGAQPASDTRILESEDPDRSPAHPLVAVVPIGVVVLVTGLGLWFDGRQTCLEMGMVRPTLRQVLNHADSYAVLMWACLAGAVVAGALACGTRRLTLQQTVEGWVAGAKAMLIAVVILILAWALSEVCNVLQTAPYLVQVCRAGLPASLLPAVVFLLAATIGFATGTSWGTMAILMPLVYPLGLSLPQFAGLEPTTAQSVHLAAVSAVLAGSVFGDHCSPISDTTILSSLASGADHVDHVRTQLPYAATVALVAILTGYLPVGWGVPAWLSLTAGAVLLLLWLLWVGRRPETEESS
jgi:Na+/H+ antiporter NhaC